MDAAHNRVMSSDPLSEAAVAATCAHIRFHDAVHSFVADALAEYEQQDTADRWLTRDQGRTSLYMGAALLDRTMVLSVASLAAAAAHSGACSRGRVLAFVEYARASGRIVVPPGSEPWVQRRLTLTSLFSRLLLRRVRGGLLSAAMVAPEVEEALPYLTSDAGSDAVLTAASFLLVQRPQLQLDPGGPFRKIFIAREGGIRLMEAFLLRQTPNRDVLLESCNFNRSELSRRFGVSRSHINGILSDAEAAGVLRLSAPDRVEFDEAFSREVAAFYGGLLQVFRACAQTVLAARTL